MATNQGWGTAPSGIQTGDVISGSWGQAIMTPSGPASQSQLGGRGGGWGVDWGTGWMNAGQGVPAVTFPTAPHAYKPPTSLKMEDITTQVLPWETVGGFNVKDWVRNEYTARFMGQPASPWTDRDAALYSLMFNNLNNRISLAGDYNSWQTSAQIALQNPKAQALIQQAKDNNCDVTFRALSDDSKAIFDVYATTTTRDRGMEGTWAFDTVTGKLEAVQPGQGAIGSVSIPSNVPIIRTGEMFQIIDSYKGESDYTASWLRTPIARERFENQDLFGAPLTDDELKASGIDAPVVKTQLRGISSYLTGESTLQDLVNQGIIPATELKDITDWVEKSMVVDWRVPTETTAVSEGGQLLEKSIQEIRQKYAEEHPEAFKDYPIPVTPELRKQLDISAAVDEIRGRAGFINPLDPSNWKDMGAMVLNYMENVGKLGMAYLSSGYLVARWLTGNNIDRAEAIVGEDIYWTPGEMHNRIRAGEKVSAREYAASLTPDAMLREYEAATFPKFVKGTGEFVVDFAFWTAIFGTIDAKTAMKVPEMLAKTKINLKQAQLISETMDKVVAGWKGQTPKSVLKLADKAAKETLTLEKALEDLTVRSTSQAMNKAAAKVSAEQGTLNQLAQVAKAQKAKTGKITSELADDILESKNKQISAMNEWQVAITDYLNPEVAPKVGELAELPSFEKIGEIAFAENNARRLGVLAARVPVLKHVLGGFDPTLRSSENLVRENTIKLTIAYGQAKELADLAIRPLYKEAEVLGTVMRPGAEYRIAKNVVGEPDALIILQSPQKYRFADNMGVWAGKVVADHPQIKATLALRNQLEAYITKHDIPIELLKMQEGMEWMPRGMQDIVKSGFLSGSRKFHARPEQMSRVYMDISDGIEKGIAYDADWRMLLRKHAQNIYELDAEKMFAEAVKPLGSSAFPTQLEMELTAAKKTATYLAKDAMDKLPQGAKMNAATLAAIERRSPELAAAIKEGRPLAELRNVATREAQGARANLARLQAEMDDVRKMVDIHGTPAFEGWKFPPEIAKEIQRATRNSPIDPFTSTVSQANSLIRMSVAGFDFGVGWIQGQLLLARSPEIWGKATVNSLKAMGNPSWFAGFASAHATTIRDMAVRGRNAFNSTEFMEGAGLLSKIPVVGKIARAFERQFNAYLDTARVYLWEAFEKPRMTDIEAANLGAVIDNMMGTLNSSKLGIKPYQRAVEAAYMSFSPRYRRSGVALLIDTLQGGVRGAQARKAIGSWLAAGGSVYYAISKALGQEPDFNPSSSNFMTATIAGMKVRLGGQYLTMMRLLSNITATAQNNPERFISLDTRDEPLLKYLRGQSAPFIGLATTLITQETYLGEPITPWNNFLKNVAASTMMPFALQPLLQDYPNNGVPALPIEFGGLITWPESTRTKLNDLLDKESQAKYGIDYRTLTRKDKRAAEEITNLPVIRDLQALAIVEENQRGIGSKKVKQQTLEWRGKFQEINDTQSRTLWLAEAAYTTGKITESGYYYAIKRAGAQYAEASKTLREEYPDVYAQWGAPHKAQKGESIDTMAYWDYMDTVYGDTKLNELEGQDYFDRLSQLKKDFKAKWGDEAYNYAITTTMAGKNLPTIYKARKADLDDIGLSGYWDLSKYGDNAMQEMFVFRQMNPKVDAELYTWGYVSTLQTQDAVDLARTKIQILGIPKGIPAALSQNEMNAEYDRLVKEQESLAQTAKRAPYTVALSAMWDTRTSITGAIRNYETQLGMTTSPTKQADILQKLDIEYAKLSQLYQLAQGYAKNHYNVRTRQFLNALERDRLEQTRRKSRVAATYP